MDEGTEFSDFEFGVGSGLDGSEDGGDTDEFVVCVKFRFGRVRMRGLGGEGEGEEDPNVDGDWIILDMLDENGTSHL